MNALQEWCQVDRQKLLTNCPFLFEFADRFLAQFRTGHGDRTQPLFSSQRLGSVEIERYESASVGEEPPCTIRVDSVEILGKDTLVDHSVALPYLSAFTNSGFGGRGHLKIRCNHCLGL